MPGDLPTKIEEPPATPAPRVLTKCLVHHIRLRPALGELHRLFERPVIKVQRGSTHMLIVAYVSVNMMPYDTYLEELANWSHILVSCP